MSLSTVSSVSCQVYPSEYAFRYDSVSSLRVEGVSANCVRYQSGLQENVYTELYIHNDGTQLWLSDSDLRQEQYSPVNYYLWPAGNDGKLLFIFPKQSPWLPSRCTTTVTETEALPD